MRRVLVANPFLCLALLGFALMFAWAVSGPSVQGHPAGAALHATWTTLLRPFAMVATWVDPALRRGPEWLDVVATGVLGLLPYALLDLGVRRMVLRGRMRTGPAATGAGSGASGERHE